jgi:signal transduction histidine kinase
MTLNKLFLLFGAGLVALAETSRGQKVSNWRVYRAADGMSESACMSLALGPHGRILVRHLNVASISELDGYSITNIPSLKDATGRVYESPSGQRWTVMPEGLQEFKDRDWVLHPVEEIAAEFRAGTSNPIHPVPLYPVKQDLVIFLLPERLMVFNAKNSTNSQTSMLRAADQTRLGNFSGMSAAHDGGLWIAGAHGLAKIAGPARNVSPETEWREYVPPESLQIQNLQEPQEDEEGGITVLAESSNTHQKTIVHFDGQRWTVLWTGTEKIRFAWRGPDEADWAATIDSLFRLEDGRLQTVENEEISARQYFDLATGADGTFWLATSGGLFRYALPLWRNPIPKLNSSVAGLVGDGEGRFWFISRGSLHLLQNNLHQEYSLPGAIEQNPQPARPLFPLKNGTLLLDTGSQLLQFNPSNGLFSAVSITGGSHRVNPLGLLKDGSLCLQYFNPGAAGGSYHLNTFDGTEFKPFPYPQPDSASSNTFSTLFAGKNGDLWLSGDRDIAWYHENKWQSFSYSSKAVPEAVLCFTELADGKIWAATQDKIWQFDGHNWLTIKVGFDHINSMLTARDGSVWVASNNGTHHLIQGMWVENGMEEGLPGAVVREIYEDQRGIWAATAHGLSLFHPEADTDPPQTYIQNLTDNEKNIPEGGVITLNFSGQDRWKYTPRERLLFSHRLEEHDWSPFQEATIVSISDLPAGKHVFQVRAMDRKGNITGQGTQDPKPAQLEFVVILPWHKEPRLVLISIAGLAVAIFFAGLAFNRHWRLLRSHAEVEKKIAERTRELEIANRELLHSQKMTALGTLAAGIAHDFNNILSIVKGSAQIIEDNLDNPQKVRVRVDRIKTVVEQGAGIVKAMLGFSRSSDEQPGLCDLNAVVDDTIKLLGDRFLQEVEVGFERAPNLPEVSYPKDLIQQILLNFIFNAAESMSATAGRKQVILATRQLDNPPADMVLMPAQAGAYVSISVRDFGCGIPPENTPRIFEPFFTTKALSARRGTGLGLSMAYELAKKMEAGLAVESAVNQGSTFTLILPVRNLPADTKALI